MQRREVIQKTAMAIAAFGLSRDLFAREVENFLPRGMQPPEGVIKLSSNENPHGPSPMARKAMTEAVNSSNRYPWESTTMLREKIAKQFSLTKEHVIIGAGSSELLGVASAYTALKKGNVVAPDPTFRLWIPACTKLGLEIKLVPLGATKAIDLNQLNDAVDVNTKMIYICNPNNPTGTVIPSTDLEAYIKKVPPTTLILLDEAYTEFDDVPSMAKMVNDHPNLLIAKTFSKIHGMAGARIGFGLAHPDTIKAFGELQPWANAGAGAVSLAGALASLDDLEFQNFCRKENQKAKAIFYEALKKANMPYIPSATSFVYFDSKPYGKDVKKILEAKKIVGARTFEDGSSWIRLSIGTTAEMQKVKEALG